jgi:hypothetical protein
LRLEAEDAEDQLFGMKERTGVSKVPKIQRAAERDDETFLGWHDKSSVSL